MSGGRESIDATGSPGGGVREARRGELRRISFMLGRAFEDDPVAEFLFPDPAVRVLCVARFYRAVVPDLIAHGVLHVDSELRCAAVWQAPAPPIPGPLRAVWLATRMLFGLRGALGRAQEVGAVLQRAHPVEPHWYLGILGTDPPQQGRGLGSAVLAPILRRCDEQKQIAYLESSKRENIAFYERHGFAVVEEIQIPAGPVLWSMRRPSA